MRIPIAALALASCGSEAARERVRYLEAMELVTTDPEQAWILCARLPTPGLADDCGLTAIEAWAEQEEADHQVLLARCATLRAQVARDECAFQVAERTDFPAACDQAGAFADDCRLHVFTLGLPRWVPGNADLTSPALVTSLAAETRRVGLPEGDLRASSATFRHILDQQPILDRGACRALEAPLQEACWRTGEALFLDRLNQARDHGTLPCRGAPLPPLLEHTEDPWLDDVLARRQAETTCSGEGG